jgi:hypothetical protein
MAEAAAVMREVNGASCTVWPPAPERSLRPALFGRHLCHLTWEWWRRLRVGGPKNEEFER